MPVVFFEALIDIAFDFNNKIDVNSSLSILLLCALYKVFVMRIWRYERERFGIW